MTHLTAHTAKMSILGNNIRFLSHNMKL